MDGASEFFKHYNDPDKDHRYMAVSDLLTDVQKPTWKTPSGGDPNKLCEKVVECLSDNSGDISALAVKWCAVYTLARQLSQLPSESLYQGQQPTLLCSDCTPEFL